MANISTVVRELVVFLVIAFIVILAMRRLAIPYTLGLVVVGLLIGISGLFPEARLSPELVLFVFLPALLFEGSWSIDTQRLRANWVAVFLLAGPGLALSLVLIAVPLHWLAGLTWGSAFLLAAILSPTDPVAVLSLFRHLKVDKDLSMIIEGESLFNDGAAGSFYQTFLAFILLAVQGQPITGGQVWMNGIRIFLLQAGGGVLIGIVCGFLLSRLVKLIDDPLIETTLTILTAYGVYLLADTLHTSGILAVILAALLLGSYGRKKGMSELTQETIDNFWSVIAFVANALLFLLVGLQLNRKEFFSAGPLPSLLIMAGLAIISVLLSRLIVVLMLPRSILPATRTFLASWRFVIFWSGLRGAFSLALVLALPSNVPSYDALVVSTYAVVLFTLLVQGFSLRVILRRLPSVAQ